MTLKRAFIYTITVFTFLCLVSYLALGQVTKLSMKEALALTLENNREIKTSALDIDRAHEQVTIAASQQRPVVGVSGQVAHYFKAPAFFGFGPATNGNEKIAYGRFGGKDQVTAFLYVNQPIYNAVNRPALQYAHLQEKESNLSFDAKRNELAAVISQTYIQLLVLNERIKLQQQSLARNEKALQDARSLLAQGRALRVDTLRAYTSVKNLEPELLKLSNAVEVGEQQLRVLTGLDAATKIELTDSLKVPSLVPPLSEVEIYREAKEHRPDIQLLDVAQSLQDQRVKIALGAKKPVVSATGQYMLQSQANDFNYFNAYYPTTSFIGVQVAVPIFNGFGNKAKISQARIERKQASLRSENAVEQLHAEVKQVVGTLRETSARIITQTNVKETAQMSYDMTQYRYTNGVASRLELTDAELALTTAESNYLEAVYDLLSAKIALQLLVGKHY